MARLFVLPSASDLKRAHESTVATSSKVATAKSSNQVPVVVRLTNTVENFSAELTEFTGRALTESELRVDLFERMNERPILESRESKPTRFLDRLPLQDGALLSRNPNARRNPLEVDGW